MSNLKNQEFHINALIDRCLKNDQAAFLEVYNNYYKMMYNTAYRMLHDEMTAEDMMQESFLKAFESLKDFKRKSRYQNNVIPFAAWLKRILINKCINFLRSNKMYFSDHLEVVDTVVETEEESDFSNYKVQVVLDTIHQLPERYKVLINLHLIEGYDYEEITEILGITNQNCRTSMSRAKTKLRTLVQQAYEHRQI